MVTRYLSPPRGEVERSEGEGRERSEPSTTSQAPQAPLHRSRVRSELAGDQKNLERHKHQDRAQGDVAPEAEFFIEQGAHAHFSQRGRGAGVAAALA